MIQKSPKEVPGTCRRCQHAGHSGGAAVRLLPRKVPTPEQRVPPNPQVRRGRGGPCRTGPLSGPAATRGAVRASPSPPDHRQRASRREAREGKKEGPTMKWRQHVNKIAARWAGRPDGSSESAGSRKCPALPSGAGTSLARQRLRDTCLAAQGVWFHPPRSPTHSERGRARGTKTLDLQSEGASAGRT